MNFKCRPLTVVLLLFGIITLWGQSAQKLEFNKTYDHLKLSGNDSIVYTMDFKKNGIYQFSLNQEGIAIYYTLQNDKEERVYESNFPDDIYGLEKFEYSTTSNGKFTLTIKRFNNPQNTNEGQVSVFVKSLNKKEIKIRNKIKEELVEENKKIVTSIDIDHFWEAFDLLKKCKTKADSVHTIQTVYLDRATNGMVDFIQARELTAEKFVEAISQNKGFYSSIRSNTYITKKAEPIVAEVFKKFSALYTDFKPFKVCFAIGINNTGGTVTNQYVLIGSEITTSVGLGDNPTEQEIIENIRGIVAHECVHTQQHLIQKDHAIECPLLFHSIKEGAADFIAELISGTSRSSAYGEQHEKSLWIAFKNELCNQDISNWLYNGHTVKDRPGDLGYYVGYEIVKSYYNKAYNKQQAIVDIIKMDDPVVFLNDSQYDLKF